MMIRWLIIGCIFFCAFPTYAATKIQTISTSNGLTAWLVEDHSLPLVTIKIAYEDSGAAYDPAGKEGLASFAAQMLDEGAGTMDALTFHRALEDTAARFNAEASEDMFVVSLQTLSQFKQQTLTLLELAIDHPRFDSEAVTRVQSAMLADLRQMEENPGYIASKQWKTIAFAHHPYEHPRYGSASTLGALSQKDLQFFWAEHLNCNRKRIVITGDMTNNEVKSWLTSLSSAPCPSKPPTVANITIVGRAEPYRITHDIPQTVIEGGLPAVGHSDPRYYALTVLNYILGGDALTSKLGKEIRDKRGLAYTVDSHIEEFDHASYIALHFATRAKESEKAMGVFNDVLHTLADKGITAAELADAKSYLTGSFPLQMDSQESLANYLVAIWHKGLGQDYLQRRNGLIEAVTLDEVNNTAKTFLSAAPLIVMVGRVP